MKPEPTGNDKHEFGLFLGQTLIYLDVKWRVASYEHGSLVLHRINPLGSFECCELEIPDFLKLVMAPFSDMEIYCS